MTTPAADSGAPPERPWWRASRQYRWWRIPLYPAAFLSAFVVLTWANAGLPGAMVLRPLLVVAIASLGATLVVAALLLDRDRAGLVVSALALLVLSSDDRTAIILAVIAVLIVIEGLVHRGRPSWMAALATRVLSGLGVIVAMAVLIAMTQAHVWPEIVDEVTAGPLPPAGVAAADLPDIYVLLLDAYPGDRAASQGTDFDIDAFPERLMARGFDVVRDAHSNYLLTPLTLSSMLTMRHLVDIDVLAPPYGPPSRDWQRLRRVLDQAPVLATLRAAGYETIVLDAGYAHAHLARVDRFIEPSLPQELEVALMNNTRIAGAIEAVVPGTMAELARKRVEASYAELDRVASEPHDRPRLVFVHVPAPHPPWVFEADGSPRDPAIVSVVGEPGLSRQAALDVGLAQASHIADLTTTAIDHVTASSSRLPVIVVMSDHGPAAGFSTIHPLSSDTATRSSNFMAALTPGHPGLIGDHLTPVNIFPVLFGAYLGRDEERQPDTTWAWRDSYLDAVRLPPVSGSTR